MRVLFDMTLAGRARAGTYSYATQLVAALKGRDDVHIAVTELPKRFAGRNLVYRVANAAEITLWTQRGLPRAARREDADLIHLPTYIAPAAAPCPYVITMFDLTFRTMPTDRLWGLYAQTMAGVAVRHCAAITALSFSAQLEIERTYPAAKGKVFVIPGGVDSAYCTRLDPSQILETCARLGVPRPYVLAVGSLDRRKNLGRLLTAFDYLKQHPEHKGLQLVLAGAPGEAAASLASQIASLRSGDSVHWLGYVAQADLPALYQGAALLAFPSLWEGFGFPILEAMASGIPVLTSNVSSMPEVAGGAALLVNPLEPREIEEAIDRLLKDQGLREDLASRGRKQAARLTWEETAAKMVDLYRTGLRNS